MAVFEILGFQGLVYLLLVLGFVVIRYVWRNAEEKREEVMRLVQDTTASMTHMEAYSDSDEISFSPSNSASFESSNSVSFSHGYQCAVCYSPTTMRCARCKAVRYWFVS